MSDDEGVNYSDHIKELLKSQIIHACCCYGSYKKKDIYLENKEIIGTMNYIFTYCPTKDKISILKYLIQKLNERCNFRTYQDKGRHVLYQFIWYSMELLY